MTHANQQQTLLACVTTDAADKSRDGQVDPDHVVRHTWSRKTEYVLSMVGYCVGLGNVWRFPYVCIRNGGGAFLIPFVICLAVCGLPLYFMEVAMGQFMSRGAFHVWNICPLFKGIGIGQIVAGFISSWYYVIPIAWISIYLANSFKSPLPWTLCGQDWNTPLCVPQGSRVTRNESVNISFNASDQGDKQDLQAINITASHMIGIRPASEEFWINNVLQLSSGLEDMDGLPWHTTLALLISCLLVFICLSRGVKSVGKVVYITATLPYILITVLIIKGATLPGAVDGVLFYISPDFRYLVLVIITAVFHYEYRYGTQEYRHR